MLHEEPQEQYNENSEDKIGRSIAVIQQSSPTLLQIVPVRVHGAGGRARDTLAMLDPGSQTSLCADTIINDLNTYFWQ